MNLAFRARIYTAAQRTLYCSPRPGDPNNSFVCVCVCVFVCVPHKPCGMSSGGGLEYASLGGDVGVRRHREGASTVHRPTVALVLVGYAWGAIMTAAYLSGSNSSSAAPPSTDPTAHCDGAPPNMLGTYNFSGFRLGVDSPTGEPPSHWTDGFSRRAIAGQESCPWQENPYFMLAVNSPLGLVRRLCAINPDMRSALCTGTDATDALVTERVVVTEVSPNGCRALSLGITTWKTYAAAAAVGGEAASVDVRVGATPAAFVDGHIVAHRVSDEYPASPPPALGVHLADTVPAPRE